MDKKYITTPVTINTTRTGIFMFPFQMNDLYKTAIKEENIPFKIVREKDNITLHDRKLSMSLNGKSYSCIAVPRPIKGQSERREPDKCYTLIQFTSQHKAQLTFCTQLQMMIEDVQSTVACEPQSEKALLQKQLRNHDRRRKIDELGGLAGSIDQEKEEKTDKKQKKKVPAKDESDQEEKQQDY